MRSKPLTDRRGEVRELTRVDLRQFKPAGRVLASRLLAVLPKRKRGQRGPQVSPCKRQVTLRVDPDVLAFFKSTGPGWQTRMNRALREAMRAG
jgi:uncharacterized protein (DUF4415 family)